jgi:hypothetical protein
MEISQVDNKPLYNSRIIDTYLKLIKRKYSYVNIGELLSYAKMEPYQVEDEGHWFTQEQVDLFYENVRKLTGNKNIAREAGRYSASPETLGAIKKHILGLIGPANVYEIAGKATSKYFVRSARYESRRIGRNKVEITVTPYEGVTEKLYQCENRLGFWEAVAGTFNYRIPKIQHPECMFEGGKVCRYIVSWQESRFAFWKKIRNYTTLLVLAFCVVYYFVFPQFTLSF